MGNKTYVSFFLSALVVTTVVAIGAALTVALFRETPPSSPSPTGSRGASTSAWVRYEDQNLGVSFSYPPEWFELDPLETPDGSFRYFATKRVGAPLELERDDAWITFASRSNHDLNAEQLAERFGNAELPTGTSKTIVRNHRPATVGGVSGVRQIEDSTKAEGTEGAYVDAVYVVRGNNLFVISLLVSDESTSKVYLPAFDSMISSVRFR